MTDKPVPTYATLEPDKLGDFLDRQTRKTKIVATLGPASIDKIPEMIQAGVSMFRFNFSHVTDHATQVPILEKVRMASKVLNTPVACLADMGGPKIRCNTFNTPTGTVPVETGRKIHLKLSDEPGDENTITTSIPQLFKQLEVGHRVLIDDGNLTTKVTGRISATELELTCSNAWIIKSKKGLNTPDIALDIPAITEKDKKDLSFAWAWRFDYIALSFVQRGEDVREARMIMEELRKVESAGTLLPGHPARLSVDLATWRPLIVSKIETPGALDNIDGIIAITDALMVARGDLSIEIQAASMISAPVPTRAEVSDVANAVLDGSDAVMLSGEAAVGKYPVEAVATMAQIAKTAERIRIAKDIPLPVETVGLEHSGSRSVPEDYRHAIADGCVSASERAKAQAIIVFTSTGDMAVLLSKRKPNCYVIALTGSLVVVNRLALYSGVFPVYSPMLAPINPTVNTPKASFMDLGDCLADAENICSKMVKSGDRVIYCAGYFNNWSALSDSIRLSVFGDSSRAKKAKEQWAALKGSFIHPSSSFKS